MLKIADKKRKLNLIDAIDWQKSLENRQFCIPIGMQKLVTNQSGNESKKWKEPKWRIEAMNEIEISREFNNELTVWNTTI